jgi:hypothetical protein
MEAVKSFETLLSYYISTRYQSLGYQTQVLTNITSSLRESVVEVRFFKAIHHINHLYMIKNTDLIKM